MHKLTIKEEGCGIQVLLDDFSLKGVTAFKVTRGADEPAELTVTLKIGDLDLGLNQGRNNIGGYLGDGSE